MKRLPVYFLMLFSFIYNYTFSQNPISSLNLELEFDEVLSDSLEADMYQLKFVINLTDTSLLSQVHCKLGITPTGSELFYKAVNIDGSNEAVIDVDVSYINNNLVIDFGTIEIPVEFYAEVVGISADNIIFSPITFF